MKTLFRRAILAGILIAVSGNATQSLADEKPEFEVTAPPAELKIDPFYKKYVSANGLPVIASEKVNDYALKEAAFLITEMLALRPDILAAMVKSGSRMCNHGAQRVHHRPPRLAAHETERLLGRPRARHGRFAD